MNKNLIANEILKIITNNSILKEPIKNILLNLIINNIHDTSNNICLRNKTLDIDNLNKYKLFDEDILELKFLLKDLLCNCKHNKDDLLLIEKFIKDFYINCEVCNNKYPITIMSKNYKILCPECQNLSQQFNENYNFKKKENLNNFIKQSKILLPQFNIYQLREIYRKLYYN